MKRSLLAFVLALTVASWAQTATQTPPSSAAPADKDKASCCDKMANAKTEAACPRKKGTDGKEAASCCAGKEAMASCCKDAKECMKDDKMSASCCNDSCGKNKIAANCCGKDCGKTCCSGDKKEKTAIRCCEHELHS